MNPEPPPPPDMATPPPAPAPAPEPVAEVQAIPRGAGRAGAVAAGGTIAAAGLLVGATVAGAVLHAPPAFLVIAVTFLPYSYVALIVWTFGLWAVAPDRPSLPVLLGALVVTGLMLWGPSWGASTETVTGENLKVMSWNVRRLWGGPSDGEDPTQCVEAAIKAVDPDVLTLLEVSELDLDQLSYRLGLQCVHTPYQGSGGRQVGGLASCVRGDSWTLRKGAPMRFVDDEAWYYAFAEVERDGRVFNLLSVHLYPYDFSANRLRAGVSGLLSGHPGEIVGLGIEGAETVRAQGNQSAALLERVGKFNDPTLVARDFNSVRDLALHRSLRGHLVDTWERGGHGQGATVRFLDSIPLRVDYIYATESFAVRGASVPDVGCSDHRPVVTELTLRQDR